MKCHLKTCMKLYKIAIWICFIANTELRLCSKFACTPTRQADVLTKTLIHYTGRFLNNN